MNRALRRLVILVPLVALATAPLLADVKTHDRTSVKFEGFLGRMMGMFGGKAAKEGLEGTVAVKGTRKASFNDSTGHIVDLSEEKVYDLDMKKKTYTVTTFDELRRRMREQEEKAAKANQKEAPSQREEQKPQQEYEVDFDVKDTGQHKQIAGYDTHEVVATVTVREKGKTLEDGGGIVMTNDMWMGPVIPQLKELSDFEMRYWKQLQQGAGTETISPEQMAMVIGSFPGIKSAMQRFAQEGNKLQGTALDTMTTFESVKSPEQLADSQQQSSGGGISGMLAKKMMKRDEPKARSTVFTTHHEYLSIDKTVDASDLAIPPDFKEKK